MKKFILITGMGHSGTRHPFSVLQRHPQVFAPEKKLNGVKEFSKLHEYFEFNIDQMSIDDESYYFDEKKLFRILDEYFRDSDKEINIIKFPEYPLFCLELFKKYFNNHFKILVTKRNFDNIYESYLNRNEVSRVFSNSSIDFIRYVKKLNKNDRLDFINLFSKNKNNKLLFEKIFDRINLLVNKTKKEFPLMEINLEDSGNLNKIYKEVFRFLELDSNFDINIDEITNKNRLSHQTYYSFKSNFKRKFPKIAKIYRVLKGYEY